MTDQRLQLWIGLGGVVVLLTLLVVAFFLRANLTHDQRNLMRLFSALTAGFAGALITGSALFELNSTLDNGMKLGISGTAGFALFFTVWVTYKMMVPPPDAFNFSTPVGWTFRQVADSIGELDKSVVEFVGFTPEELAATLDKRELKTRTPSEALVRLRVLSRASPIREYQVAHEDGLYRLTVRRDT